MNNTQLHHKPFLSALFKTSGWTMYGEVNTHTRLESALHFHPFHSRLWPLSDSELTLNEAFTRPPIESGTTVVVAVCAIKNGWLAFGLGGDVCILLYRRIVHTNTRRAADAILS